MAELFRQYQLFEGDKTHVVLSNIIGTLGALSNSTNEEFCREIKMSPRIIQLDVIATPAMNLSSVRV
jgi:hypothetical protein